MKEKKHLDGNEIAARFIRSTSWDRVPEVVQGNEATILLHDRRASAAGAAFANACAANALDCDDGVEYTRGHQGAQVFPTALALSEALGLSGSAMLTEIAPKREAQPCHIQTLGLPGYSASRSA